MIRNDGYSEQDELKKKLKELIPSAFEDGEVNIEIMKSLIGLSKEDSEAEQERFGLQWMGKSEAIRSIQSVSEGTLRPSLEKRFLFNNADNLVIEGDNLEALKVLLKSYYSKIKLVYIDPPYNTGNDFIYRDNFSEPIMNYMKQTGQIDTYGDAIDSDYNKLGRKHSNWLNMMYPRLYIARNFLKEDGVILVSIDDNEYANLKNVMDEIYGEENMLGSFIWKRRQKADNRNQNMVSSDHEYVLAYGKSGKSKFKGVDTDKSKYTNPDNDPRGPWASIDLTGLANKRERPNLHYDLIDPETNNVFPPHPGRGWSKSKGTMNKLISNGEILFPKNKNGRPRQKKFLKDILNDKTGFSSVLTEVGYTTDGTRELRELFEEKVFPFPKPTKLISAFIEQVCGNDDIVMDFFAGSGTTAHAVMKVNKNDGGKRKYILVQLPEKVNDDNFENIIDITMERIDRAAKDLGVTHSYNLFRLDSSNFRKWSHDITSAKQLSEQMEAWRYPILEERTNEDVLYEVLLNGGVELTTEIEKYDIGDNSFFMLKEEEQIIIVYVDQAKLAKETLNKMKSLQPTQVWILDEAFGTDDEKKNVELQWKEEGIAFRTI